MPKKPFVNYLGREVLQENFRAFVYDLNNNSKLMNSYVEFEEAIKSGEWFPEMQKEDLLSDPDNLNQSLPRNPDNLNQNLVRDPDNLNQNILRDPDNLNQNKLKKDEKVVLKNRADRKR